MLVSYWDNALLMSQTSIIYTPQKSRVNTESIPKTQSQLLLLAPKQPYQVHHYRDIPEVRKSELLVKVEAIGLNPIDWKSAEYGYALPAFPCVNGREFVGRVVRTGFSCRTDIEIGDYVLAISTDYRDFRKSGFQEYAVVEDSTAVKLGRTLRSHVASVGVAFVAAVLALGICLGLNFERRNEHALLNILSIAQSQDGKHVPPDVFDEIFTPFAASDRLQRGDCVLIYGASCITAQVAIQLCKRAGVHVVAVADRKKHGRRLDELGADKIIDRYDLAAASSLIQRHIKSPIRFAIDAIGSQTASWCQDLLVSYTRIGNRNGPVTPELGTKDLDTVGSAEVSAHLVCLSGTPKTSAANVQIHRVPIKLFHTNPKLGAAISALLSAMLHSDEIKLPETVIEDGGLHAVVTGLEKLKSGELSGRKLVVRI